MISLLDENKTRIQVNSGKRGEYVIELNSLRKAENIVISITELYFTLLFTD